MMKIASVGLAALVLVGPSLHTAAHAQVTKQGQGYLFRMKFTPGSTIRYTITSTVNPPAGTKNAKPMTFSMPQTMRVKSVDKGIATIESTVDMSSMSPNAKPQTTTIRMDSRGNLIGNTQGMSSMSTSFPQGPIRIGQSWNAKMNQQGMSFDGTYTLKSVRRVGSQELAEIAMSIKGGGGQAGTISGTGTMQVRTSDGSLQGMNMNMRMAMGQQGTMNMSMRMVRN